ncbi:hypothetical protein DQ239_04710 [Blastococcus sp. TF02-09]|uniref:hypothetical protein n=1 Tax=Blastococcus sp. TF02-09 TaxID=2250576 RepID=UPI000DE86639|nr:hypothetical protein [Blastococcus sp. TF02-9]RBY80358.1 hypothetical protein DQ239_04710 [Blastococcus sp. TF02-9]
MQMDDPVWQMLERPRALSQAECRVIARLATAVDEPLLHRQAASATVAAVCRCGCSSIRLNSDEQPIPEPRVVELSQDDRPDYFQVNGFGHTPDLLDVQVVLHVIQGRVYELEVFAGEEGVAVSLASLSDLADVTVD